MNWSCWQERIGQLAAGAKGERDAQAEGERSTAQAALAELQQHMHQLRADLRNARAESAASCASAQQKVLNCC